MKEGIFFTLVGGILGYIGSIIQHNLETKRQRESEIRQEKIRIYSKVLTELSGLFIDAENYAVDSASTLYAFKFSIQLGRILGPARLIASEELENKLRDLYSDEVAWHDYMAEQKETKPDEKWTQLAETATRSRMQVETIMRKEIIG